MQFTDLVYVVEGCTLGGYDCIIMIGGYNGWLTFRLDVLGSILSTIISHQMASASAR